MSIKLNFDQTSRQSVNRLLRYVRSDERVSAPALHLFGNLDCTYLPHYQERLRDIAAEYNAFRVRLFDPFLTAQVRPEDLLKNKADQAMIYKLSFKMNSDKLDEIYRRLSQMSHFTSTEEDDSKPFTEKWYFHLCDGLSKATANDRLARIHEPLTQVRVIRLRAISFRLQEHIRAEDTAGGIVWVPAGDPRFIPLISAGAQRLNTHQRGREWLPKLRRPEPGIPVRWSPYVKGVKFPPHS